MMLQILKKLNFNSLAKSIFSKNLVANLLILATGFLVVNSNAQELSYKKDKSLFIKPIKNLSDKQYDTFILGRSFFTIPWVEAPSATTARDGLGPLFNANTCASCHPGNGRGNLYNKDNQFSRNLIGKLSIKNRFTKEHKEILKTSALIMEPNYGMQIAINGIHGVNYEAKPDIKFKEKKVIFSDGEIAMLLKPTYALKDLQYGPLHKDAILTFRLAPSLNGLGLIEDISDKDILKNQDEFDKNNDGISGRANFVYSAITKEMELGRYSWKASIATLKQQTADAANNDMGITTSIFPNDTCTKNQKACNEAPKPRDSIDLTDLRLDAITYYLKNRKTYSAKKDKAYKEGLEIFKTIGCISCHIDSFVTKKGVEISPFTDMLLHDMGEELADGRSEFKARGNEWRTPPLWGLALHEKINKRKPRLLHDGRARDFQEAILWHGGEARTSKENYMNLEKELRKKLIKFLEKV